MESQFRVAVLVACYNRREKTVTALQSLIDAKPGNWDLRVYLSDDGSTDGTAEAVGAMPISVKVIQGPGNWYWARSMYQAEIAIDEEHDAILWLNDDVELSVDALEAFDQLHNKNPLSILVGQFCDPQTGEITYGGMRRLGHHPFRYETVLAQHSPQVVDTMHGNLVFIPRTISMVVGTIDGDYSHAYGDIDFGLRARYDGFEILATPGFAGTCPQNPAIRHASIRERLKAMHSPKGTPTSSQIRFLKRHGDVSWPIYFVAPYVRALLTR